MQSDNEETNGAKALDVEKVLEDATPPSVWSDEFIERLSEDCTEDCGLRLDLLTVTFPDPTLGNLQGLDQAEEVTRDIEGLVGKVVNILRSNLPETLNKELDDIVGPFTPPDPLPIPIPDWFILPPQMETYFKIGILLGKLAEKIGNMPTHFSTQPAPPPDPLFSPAHGKISISVGQDMDNVGLRIYSRMDSTYSFGREDGTSYVMQHPTITGEAKEGFDRPWFAKALIPQIKLEHQDGIPYRILDRTAWHRWRGFCSAYRHSRGLEDFGTRRRHTCRLQR